MMWGIIARVVHVTVMALAGGHRTEDVDLGDDAPSLLVRTETKALPRSTAERSRAAQPYRAVPGKPSRGLSKPGDRP